MPKTTPIKVRNCSRLTTPHYVVVPREIRDSYPDKYPAEKRFFETKRAASLFCDELREIERRGNSLAFGLSETQRVEAAECYAKLEPVSRSLREAVDFFLRHLAASKKSRALADLVEEVVAAKRKDGLTEKYLATFHSRLRIFAKDRGDLLASDFSTAEIADWLRDNVSHALTRNNYRRDLRTMFAFALDRKYVTENPVAAIAKAKEAHTEIEALTVSEVSRLLHHCDGVLLPLIAIGAFAGLRPEEINRLDWKEVDFENAEINVRPEKSKTGQRRIVKMSDNLLAWLANCRQRTGAVLPHFPRVRFENTRVRAGVDRWPHDACRHTYASMHLAHHQNTPLLARMMGHTGTDLIFRHYHKPISEKEAAAYWQLYPEGPIPK